MVAAIDLFLLPDTYHLIVVDHADRLSDKPTVTDIALLVSVEILDLILVPRPYEVGTPCKVFRYNVLRVDGDLKTLVSGLTHIHIYIRETRDLRQVALQKQVSGCRCIEVDVTVDAVVQETKVDTDVESLSGLPTQSRVTHAAAGVESCI